MISNQLEDLGAYAGLDEAVPHDAPWELTSAETIAREGVPPVQWDIEFFAERDSGPILVFGLPESLKSWLALYIARCMVTGEHFVGRFKVTPRPYAIVLNFDAGSNAIRRRIARTTSDPRLLVLSPESWDPKKLDDLLSQYSGAFVIIDCLADIFSSQPNQEPGEAMRHFIRGLRRIFERHGCGGMIIDHAKRQGSDSRRAPIEYYGSTQKKAAIRQMWSVERLADDNGKPLDRVRLRCEKASEAERFDPIVIDFDLLSSALLNASLFGAVGAAPIAVPTTGDKHRREILAQVGASGGATQKQLKVDKDGGRLRRRAFTELRDEGVVIEVSGSKPKRYVRGDPTVENTLLLNMPGHPVSHHKNGDGQSDGQRDGHGNTAILGVNRKPTSHAASAMANDTMASGSSSASSRGPGEGLEEAVMAEWPLSIDGHQSWPSTSDSNFDEEFEA